MASALRRLPKLPSLRSVAPTTARLAPSILSTSSRTFRTCSARRDAAATSPPFVGTTAGGQADMMTGEVTGAQDIDPSRLTIEQTTSPKSIPESSTLTFGRTFTDHMLCIPWNSEKGWGAPEIKPYQDLKLDPSSTVLHYAPTLFEGMKAYRNKETGVARLFRPDKNMERMTRSAARLAFPSFTGDHLTELIRKLVEVDKEWIPTDVGTSLYIRPTMIGTQAGLGVGSSTDVLLFVIMSPVGPYYKTGFKPVKLFATTDDVRAWPGGTGGYKLGSNYAGGVVPQQKAAALGYQQILWLYGPQHQLTEVGTMNLFAVFEQADGTIELVTPPLEDMILPGVTRDSIMSLAKGHADGSNSLDGLPKKFIVSERNMTMPEIVEASKDGTLKEMFGSGTAAIVSCVEGVGYEGDLIKVPVGEDGLGDVARVMLREVVGRQTGAIETHMAHTTTAESIAAATAVAQSFLTKYYASLESSSYAETHALYSPSSRITWNGNPIPYNELSAFWAQMPNSKWEKQAWDCQGIPGSDMMGSGGGSGRESLVVTVTGQVAHTAKDDPIKPSTILVSGKQFNTLPRVFAQSFILIFDPTKVTGATPTGEEGYLIGADSFRFV